MNVLVNYKNGSTSAVKPTLVELKFQSSAGVTPSCNDTWYPPISSAAAPPAALPVNGWLANPGQAFASTAITGPTASAASTSGSPQTGTLTVCAAYAGYWASVSVSNNSFTAANPATILITHGTNSGTCNL